MTTKCVQCDVEITDVAWWTPGGGVCSKCHDVWIAEQDKSNPPNFNYKEIYMKNAQYWRDRARKAEQELARLKDAEVRVK